MKFMLRSATMASVLALGVVGAHAADLTYEPAPVVAPVAFNWTGFYIGVHGGIGGGGFDTTFTDPGNFSVGWSDNAFGAFGGAQVGYNYQFSPNWVVGVEADIAAAGISAEHTADFNYGVSTNQEAKVDWFGTLRGRIGYAWDNLLIYGTGGAAYGDVESSSSYTDNVLGFTDSNSFSDTRWGWTAGAGVEYGITKNITLKTEYLYVDLGSIHTNSLNGFQGIVGDNDADIKFHTVKLGLNYKF
ncbi:membrane protein [Kaistia sp. 32K]|uniref:outer membrane protein n=1 Tax=Kaistia sp. 32K TaxID=2795690 RepID=UPI0019161431|nr:outer membrane protein [Kaistia sp. 32K]BCP53083.1 membrane protein [Kaistia sp. 32K]